MLQAHVRRREYRWEKGYLTAEHRQARFSHKGKFVVVVGTNVASTREVAKTLEKYLFHKQCNAYYLEIGNLFEELGKDSRREPVSYEEHIRQLGETARLMTDAGLIFVTTLAEADDADLEELRVLNEPNELFVVNVGERRVEQFPVAVDIEADGNLIGAIDRIMRELNARDILLDYSI